MAKDTENILTPLTKPPSSIDNVQCQPSKPPPSPPSRSPPPFDPIDLASIDRLKALGLPITTQPVKVDSVFKPLSPNEVDNLMRQYKVRKSRCGNYEHSAWPSFATGLDALECELQGTDNMRRGGNEELEDEVDETEVKGSVTAGLVNDGWRVTKGLLVVKEDVEKSATK